MLGARRVHLLEVVATGVLLTAAQAWAVDRYVNPLSPNEQSPYTTPDTAAHTIMKAMGISTAEDVIHVAPAVYVEQVKMAGGVELRAEAEDSEEPPPAGEPKPHCNAVITFGGGSVVLVQRKIVGTTIVDGFKITGGNARQGGGVLIEDSTNVVIRRCCIKTNTATAEGGGVAILRSTVVTLEHNEIEDNEAMASTPGLERGGGIFAEDSNSLQIVDNPSIFFNRATWMGGGAYLEDCDDALIARNVFISNRAEYANAPRRLERLGGALVLRGTSLVSAPDVELHHNQFVGNTANPGSGGAIAVMGIDDSPGVPDKDLQGYDTGGVDLTASDNFFVTNEAKGSTSVSDYLVRGGAILLKGLYSSATFTNDRFTANESNQHGGAVYIEELVNLLGDSEATFSTCTFEGNRATLNAGCVEVTALSHATFTSCTFGPYLSIKSRAGNHGGGVHVTCDSRCELVSCTFADCEASHGGGLSLRNSALVISGHVTAFNNNLAIADGGAIYLFAADDRKFAGGSSDCNADVNVDIRDARFLGNIANRFGGAISIARPGSKDDANLSINVSLHDTAFAQNRAAIADPNGVMPMAISVFNPSTGPGRFIDLKMGSPPVGGTVDFFDHQSQASAASGATISCWASGRGTVAHIALNSTLIADSDTGVVVTNFLSPMPAFFGVEANLLRIDDNRADGMKLLSSDARIQRFRVFGSTRIDFVCGTDAHVICDAIDLGGMGAGESGIVAQTGATVKIRSASNIRDHVRYGALASPKGNRDQIEAENVWWGHPNGPSRAGVTAGDRVSSGVDFTPWLEEPADVGF